MKGELGKYEPVFKEETDESGVKTKVRKLKLSIYVDTVDFPDVTAYDGAMLTILRPEESTINDVDEVKVREFAYKAVKEAMKILEL